jgi:hypothetical protein
MNIIELTQEEMKAEKIKIIKFAMQNNFAYDDGGSYISVRVPEYKIEETK